MTDTINVVGRYQSQYEAIVKPHQRFLIPNYFIHYWVRLLGAPLAWAVIELQQGCWRADEDRYQISRETLARRVGVSRRTLYRSFQNQWRAWLIPEIRNDTPTAPYEYHVYMWPPLTPTHQQGLFNYLEANQASIKEALAWLLDQPSKVALQEIEKYISSTSIQTELVPSRLPNWLDIQLSDAARRDLEKEIAQVRRHLTEIGQTEIRQYFRREWVPILGPKVAWLVMAMRSRGYYNPETNELRDTIVWKKSELAAIVGLSTESLKKGLLSRHPLAHYFYTVIDQTKPTLTIKVKLNDDPISPDQTVINSERIGKSDPTTSGKTSQRAPRVGKNDPTELGKMTQQASRTGKSDPTQIANREKRPDSLKYFEDSTFKKPIQEIPEDSSFSTKTERQKYWQETILPILQIRTTTSVFDRLLSDTELLQIHLDRGQAVVGSPNSNAIPWLRARLGCIVEEVLSAELGQPMTIQFQLHQEANL